MDGTNAIGSRQDSCNHDERERVVQSCVFCFFEVLKVLLKIQQKRTNAS